MHILFTLHHSLDWNAGAAGVVLRLAEQYENLGHIVTILSHDDLPARMSPKLRGLMFPSFVFYRISQIAHELDVVDASSGDSWLWLKYRARRRRTCEYPILYVTHSHGLEHIAHLRIREDARQGNLKLSWKYPLYHGGFRLWEVARSFRLADLALFLNQHELRYATTEMGVAPERARLVTNGLSRAFLDLPFEETPGDGTTIGIAQICMYMEHKGVQYSAPALNRILKRYPSVRVGLFGTRYQRDHILNDFDPDFWERIDVVARFENSDLPRLLRGYQIKLFPTLCEAFGNAVIEAMGCGLAPVTTDVPGPTDIVASGIDGLVLRPRNPDAIEEGLRLLIENRALLDRLRRNAYRKAQQYSWARIAAERLALYEEFLGRKREAAAAHVARSADRRRAGEESRLQRVRPRG